MKKNILALLLVAASVTVFAQTNMLWFNPFGFTPAMDNTGGSGISEDITYDSSGQVWFYTSNPSSVFYVVNQTGTVTHTINTPANYCLFDGANRLWLQNNFLSWGNFMLTDHDTIVPLQVPHVWDSLALEIDLVPDQYGNDYFLTSYPDANGLDSFFMTIYNGSTFQSVYLNGLGIPFNTAGDVQVRYGWCDNNGAFYIDCSSYGFMKYYQGSWSHLNLNIDTSFFMIEVDRNNNFYFQVQPNSEVPTDTPNYIIKYNGQVADTIGNPPGFIASWFLGQQFGASAACTTGPDGNLWFLTSGPWFYDLDPNSNTWTPVLAPGFAPLYNDAGSFFSYWPAIFDKNGTLWTASGDFILPYAAYPSEVIGAYSLTPFNSIKGRVFYDTNGNGVQDNGETGFTAANVVQTTNGGYANTDSAGNYAVTFTDSGIAHTISAIPPAYYRLTTPSSYTINPGDTMGGYNFGVLAVGPVQDLAVTASSYWTGPGYNSFTWLSYINTGTTTMGNTITYVFDTTLTFVQAFPAPNAVSGDTLSWNYQNLGPFHSGVIAIEFLVSQYAVAGDTLVSTATIQPVQTDTTPGNNVYVNNQVVYSSFDPNYKTVSPDSAALADQELTYTIYFQNTGTAPAVNIVVFDTLDANLNPATFRVLGSSAPVKASLQGAGILSFVFADIQLPDSAASPALSTGFVQFAIRVRNPLWHAAASVNNAAGIYFDFNPSVETNTATCNLNPNDVLGIISPTGFDISAYPNPTTGQLIIETQNFNPRSITIYDAAGRLISATPFKNEIDISTLCSGVYFVEVKGGEGVVRKRVVKM